MIENFNIKEYSIYNIPINFAFGLYIAVLVHWVLLNLRVFTQGILDGIQIKEENDYICI